jgi:Domain of unknown function DUF29
VIEHLLKLEHSPVGRPRLRWHDTIARSRRDIEEILEESPSLRGELDDAVANAFASVADITLDGLVRRGEMDRRRRNEILARPYSADQVFGPWLPQEPPRQ